MADKRDYNVGLNAKGLESFVSEEQARRMVNTRGATSLFIIEAHHGPFITNEDGSIKMQLIIDLAELVPAEQEELVRRFQRALYIERPDQYGQAAFEGATEGEPKVDDTARELDSAVVTDDAGEPVGIWTGDDEAAPEAAAEPAPEASACPHPGCILPEEHEGDHVPHPDAATTPAEFSNA